MLFKYFNLILYFISIFFNTALFSLNLLWQQRGSILHSQHEVRASFYFINILASIKLKILAINKS